MISNEDLLKPCGLRIICVLLIRSLSEANECIYRVYTSDGDFCDYYGYRSLPLFIRDWLAFRNSLQYAIPSVMFVSGCPLSGLDEGVNEYAD